MKRSLWVGSSRCTISWTTTYSSRSFGFFDEFGVEPDVPRPVIATAPLGFHPLEEVPRHLHFQLRFPLLDERRNGLVQQ